CSSRSRHTISKRDWSSDVCSSDLESVQSITNRFIDAYLEDVQALGVKKATHHPRVTETMDEIIEFISGLIDKGYAYQVDGDVYFKPRRFEGYGKLSHQSIDEL